ITWMMRQTLVDWLFQVHIRYNLLPETLWITVNIVDRFLSYRTVSLIKLQLVGITAMFIAAKYEETHFPSVHEFVIMADNRYKQEEIIKGEQIMLQALDFKVSQHCAPYNWMHKIVQGGSFDPVNFCTLKSEGLASSSGYSKGQLLQGFHLLVEKLTELNFCGQ
ncbi:cyclin-like protein, partial [Mycena galericulata]